MTNADRIRSARRAIQRADEALNGGESPAAEYDDHWKGTVRATLDNLIDAVGHLATAVEAAD